MNVVKKMKTHVLSSRAFLLGACRLWNNVETYGTATDDNIIPRMRFASWITKATDTHSEHVILIIFHGNNGYANAP